MDIVDIVDTTHKNTHTLALWFNRAGSYPCAS